MTKTPRHPGLEHFRPSVIRICFGFRISDFGFPFKALLAGILLFPVLLAAGCAQDQLPQVLRERDEARDQVRIARQQEQAAQEQLRQRDEQVRLLLALGAGKRLERVFTVQRIQIGDKCCGIGEPNAAWDKGVKVYLEPVDQDAVSIKAAGEVTIELYDLAAPQDRNRLCACRFPVEEIGKKWTQGFMSQFYIFECEWGGNPPSQKQVTVRVVFVDYLTGKTFTDQKVVEVTPPPAAPPAAPTATQPATMPASAPAASAPATATAPAPAPASVPATAPATGPASAPNKAGP